MRIGTEKQGRHVWRAWTLADDNRRDGLWCVERFEDSGTTWSLIFNPLDEDGYHLIQGLIFGTLDAALDAIEDGTAIAALATEVLAAVEDESRTGAERSRAQRAMDRRIAMLAVTA